VAQAQNEAELKKQKKRWDDYLALHTSLEPTTGIGAVFITGQQRAAQPSLSFGHGLAT